MKVKQLTITTIIGLAWSLALTGLVAAEPPATSGKMQSMDTMMQECRSHCQETTASIEQLTKRMDEAKQSHDPARMRAALDEAQQPLAEMKEHMTMCMNMMSMMQGMHGGMGGGHMGGMMQEKGAQSGGQDAGKEQMTQQKSGGKGS